MLKSTLLKYSVIYTPEDGGFTAVVPSLPGCVTYGNDLKEAQEMAKDAIRLYIESLQVHKEAIPTEEDSFIGSVNLELPQIHA